MGNHIKKMPRNFSRSSRSSTPQRTQQAPPQQQRQVQQAPPQQMPMQPQKPSMMSGLAGAMVSGVAMGAGAEVGRQAVRSFMGGSSGGSEQQQAPQEQQQQPQQIQQQPMNSNDVCFDFNTRFNDCMKYNMNNSTICQSSYDELKSCQNKI